MVNAPWLGIYMLAFNLRAPPFAGNPALRQALVLSIDRAALTRYLKYDMYVPADTLMPPLPGYRPQHPAWAALNQQQRNALARQLYAQAGYSAAHPLRVDISTSIQGADERHYFEAVAAMWRTVLGAEVGVDESEFKVLLQNRELHRLPLFLDSWIGDFADPVNFLQLFDSRSSLDYGGYRSGAFDALLDRAAQEPDNVGTLCAARAGRAGTERRLRLCATLLLRHAPPGKAVRARMAIEPAGPESVALHVRARTPGPLTCCAMCCGVYSKACRRCC